VPVGLTGVDRPSVQLLPVRRYFPFAFAALSLASANRTRSFSATLVVSFGFAAIVTFVLVARRRLSAASHHPKR
jgi:hypothetical protein